MKKLTAILSQIGLYTIAITPQVAPGLFGGKTGIVLTVIAGALGTVITNSASNHNPDGTKAQSAYIPKEEQKLVIK